MDLQQFVDKYDDQFVEVGGSADAVNQCVDLANRFIIDVLGKEPIFGTDAKDFWTRADDTYQRIPFYNPPQRGDLVIWSIGKAGHISIATGVLNGSKFQTFSQNYPLKSPAHLVDFNDDNLIGYLRSNQEVQMPSGIDENQIRKLLESFDRTARQDILGTVDEAGVKKDVDFRWSQISSGSQTAFADQLTDIWNARPKDQAQQKLDQIKQIVM